MLVHYALLERNDCVIRNRNSFGTNLRAALCNIAVTDSVDVLQLLRSVYRVERMHLQGGSVREKARPDKLIVLVVIAQHVADVLAQITLDALSELLNPVH